MAHGRSARRREKKAIPSSSGCRERRSTLSRRNPVRRKLVVFAGRKNGPTAMFGSGTYKAAFDKLCGVKDWRVHDLRRTARSLMSRAGVQTEIAERVLGHAPGGLIQIYDRHHYQDEMADALTKLAALIEQIMSSAFVSAAPIDPTHSV